MFILVNGNWPSFPSSKFDLVGLFSNTESTLSSSEYAVHCQAMFKSAIVLSQKPNFTIGWRTVQTEGDFIRALSSLCSLMSNSNIIGLIGPDYSREAHVIATFTRTLGIPDISYAATNPELSDRNAYPTFYRTITSDASASVAMTELFLRYNWTSCVIIYQNDEFGSGGNDAIRNEFDKNGLLIVESIVFDLITTSIRGDLKEILLGSPSRIVILWAFDVYIPMILTEAIQNDLVGPRFTWILRSNVSLDTFDRKSYEKLIGLLVIESTTSQVVHEPFNSELLQSAIQIWKTYEPESYPQSDAISNYALYAFDATWTLLEALHKLSFEITNTSSCYEPHFVNTSDLFEEIDRTEFLGVSGPIKFNHNTTDRIDGVYFLLQNIQSFQNGIGFSPVLQWSYSTRWKSYTQANVIVWPGNTLNIPSGFAGLQGINLKICIIQSPPFTMSVDDVQPNRTTLIGFIPDLIEILKERTDIIPEIHVALPDQTYDGVIRSVADGICDIAMGDITVTAKRREIVDFSNSIFDNSLRVLIRKATGEHVDLFSYLRPFSTGLWLTLLVGTILAAILVCFIERKDNDALKDKSLGSSAAMSLWYSIGTIMGYGADFQVQTAAGRLITIGLYLLSLILVATYTANLASDLTLAKSSDIISGIDDIKNGKLPFSRIGLLVGSSVVDYYLREVSNGNNNYFPLYSMEEMFERLLNDTIYATISDISSGEYAVSNVYCNLSMIGSDFSQSAYGIVMPKNWIYAKDLDIVILSLRETGVLDNLRKKWFQANVCKNTATDTTQSSFRISIESMSGLFVTFAVICVLSILLFAWTKRFVVKNFFFNLRKREEEIN